MKHIIRDFQLPADRHTVIVSPDFTVLDKMYESVRNGGVWMPIDLE